MKLPKLHPHFCQSFGACSVLTSSEPQRLSSFRNPHLTHELSLKMAYSATPTTHLLSCRAQYFIFLMGFPTSPARIPHPSKGPHVIPISPLWISPQCSHFTSLTPLCTEPYRSVYSCLVPLIPFRLRLLSSQTSMSPSFTPPHICGHHGLTLGHLTPQALICLRYTTPISSA